MSSAVGPLLVLMPHGRTVMTHPSASLSIYRIRPRPRARCNPLTSYTILFRPSIALSCPAPSLSLCPALCLPSCPKAPPIPVVRPLNPRSSLLSTSRRLSFYQLHPLLSFVGSPQAPVFRLHSRPGPRSRPAPSDCDSALWSSRHCSRLVPALTD